MKGQPIGEQLTRIMEQKGISGVQLARQSGVEPCSITWYRKGKRSPTVKTMVRLANALDVSYEELSGDKSPDSTERRKCAKRLKDLARLCVLSEKYKKLLLEAAELLSK